jgi:hypothetical protein
MKLIKVLKGLYRGEIGDVTVMHQDWKLRPQDRVWVVSWANTLTGGRGERKFSTLREAREFLRTE